MMMHGLKRIPRKWKKKQKADLPYIISGDLEAEYHGEGGLQNIESYHFGERESNKDMLTDGHLLLRSVNQLTDEERLQVGIVAFPMLVPFTEEDNDTLRKLALTVLDRGHLGSRTHQVLVRYGILVPFTYLNEENEPTTLPPDEIIALGWAKLKENNEK